MKTFRLVVLPLALLASKTVFSQGLPVYTNPSSTQNVVQPTNTTLQVNSLNTVLYVNPASSTDLVDQVTNLFRQCSNNCVVHIPAGTYSAGAGMNPTIQMYSIGESLVGDGRDKVIINFKGSTFLDWRTNSGQPAGEVSGFTLNCPASSLCITAGDTIGATFHDLNLCGPATPNCGVPPGLSPSSFSGEAFNFRNTSIWMERWTLRNINIVGFRTNIHFLNPTTDGSAGQSYGYGNVDGVYTNQLPGTQGVVIDQNAQVYNFINWKYQFNLGPGATYGDGTNIFNVSGTLRGTGFDVSGENSGSEYTFATVNCGGAMQASGGYSVFGEPGISVACPSNNFGNGIPPFWIGQTMDIVRLNGGAGDIPGWNGGADDYVVYPMNVAAVGAPAASSFGYLVDWNGFITTPYLAFDARTSFCLHTGPPPYVSPIPPLSPVWCTDGSGDTKQNGSLTSASVQTGAINAGSITSSGSVAAAGTVSSSAGFQAAGSNGYTGVVDTSTCTYPVFTIQGGIITNVTCSGGGGPPHGPPITPGGL